jgi:hypothetical protein
MLTSYSDEEAVIASIMAGAAGYLLKDTDAEKLIEGIETIARGGSLLDPAVTQTVLSWMQRSGVQVPGDPLSVQDQYLHMDVICLPLGVIRSSPATSIPRLDCAFPSPSPHVLR